MRRWWLAFGSNADSIDRHFGEGRAFDVPAFMKECLGGVDERIMWEFGPALRGARHRLVITAESDRYLRPMVDVLLSQAPGIPGWEFYGYRVPESLRAAELAVRGRTARSLDGWRACVAANELGGVDLTYWSPGSSRQEDDGARYAAYVATEALLGEEALLKRVDSVEVAAEPAPGTDDVALASLQAAVHSAIDAQDAALPARPLCEIGDAPGNREGSIGYIVKLEPEEASDYQGQQDLFVAKATLLPMWKRAHSGRSFDSCRFSRCGETFCYVKIDGSQGLDPAGFGDKSEIEDALDEALGPKRLGCTIGGGTGLRYSYVDLAIVDVERAIPAIREALRAGLIPTRTWLQFFDSDLAHEWVGIWEETPRPPGLNESP